MKQTTKQNKADLFENRLSARIAEAGLSEREVARRAGISNSVVTALRNGTTPPTLKVAVLLAWALNRNPATLHEEIVEMLTLGGLKLDYIDTIPLESLFSTLPRGSQVWFYLPDGGDLRSLIDNKVLKSDTGLSQVYRIRTCQAILGIANFGSSTTGQNKNQDPKGRPFPPRPSANCCAPGQGSVHQTVCVAAYHGWPTRS
jgi:transcriptional regulator with XRE-family HTH domain